MLLLGWTIIANVAMNSGGVNRLTYLPCGLSVPQALDGSRMGMQLTLMCGPHMIGIAMGGGEAVHHHHWKGRRHKFDGNIVCTRDQGGVRSAVIQIW